MALSLLKNLAKRKDGATGPLTGRTLKVQSYQVKVESVLGEGGFATIYRCNDITTKAALALKHFRLRWVRARRRLPPLPLAVSVTNSSSWLGPLH